MKALTKVKKITINDLVMCAFSTALTNYMKSKGEKVAKEIQVMIPANIRFRFYEKREDIQLENKFSCIPIRMPLTNNMDEAYGLM